MGLPLLEGVCRPDEWLWTCSGAQHLALGQELLDQSDRWWVLASFQQVVAFLPTEKLWIQIVSEGCSKSIMGLTHALICKCRSLIFEGHVFAV